MIHPVFSRLIRFPYNLLLGLAALTFVFFVHNAWSDGWRQLAAGIEYRDMNVGLVNPWSHIHVFRVHLNQNELRVVTAQSLNKKNASASEFATLSNSLIAINGGFFTHEFKPLGLRISNYKSLNPLKPISWWGIFYTEKTKAYLRSIKNFKADNKINFAIQSGPRLLVNGHETRLKPGYAQRTALGITAKGNVILLVTENLAMTTKELAKLMRAPPLSCQDALNLDGGSSSQVYAQMKGFELNVHGFSNVSDALVVHPREQDI